MEVLVADASGAIVLQLFNGARGSRLRAVRWLRCRLTGRVRSRPAPPASLADWVDRVAAAGDAWFELTNVAVDVQRGQMRLVVGPWTELHPVGDPGPVSEEPNVSNRAYVRPVAPVTVPVS